MTESGALLLAGSLVLGALLALLGYYCASARLRRLGAAKRRSPAKNVTVSDEKPNEQREVITQSSTSNKRQAKNKKRREAQQEFSHSWMIGALKGHTAEVLDIDFSANGKLLASCAEDSSHLTKRGESGSSSAQARSRSSPRRSSSSSSTPPSPSSSTKSSSSGASSSGKEEPRAILSRRQRKNRTRTVREQRREDNNNEEEVAAAAAAAEAQVSRPPRARQCPRGRQAPVAPPGASHDPATKPGGKHMEHKKPGSHRAKAHKQQQQQQQHEALTVRRPHLLHDMSEVAIVGMMSRYVLNYEYLKVLGYPILSSQPGYAMIVNNELHKRSSQVWRQGSAYRPLDANAPEFVPGGLAESDSGHASANSSDLDQDSDTDSGSSSSSGAGPGAGASSRKPPPPPGAVEHRCVRCSKPFYMSKSGDYLNEDKCVYHWGKLRREHNSDRLGWECCRNDEHADGCTAARLHVWSGILSGVNDLLDGYVSTMPSYTSPVDGNYGVFALDCEMYFSKRGLELGKVTLINVNGTIAYETFVKPDVDVVDLNTKFSGLRARDLASATKSLRDVQNDFVRLVSQETILIGHGLENDLRALRILHPTCIDTSVTFPHWRGLPLKHSLKYLATKHLRREIQTKEHDSAEDARVALELILNLVNSDVAEGYYSHYHHFKALR